MKMSNGYHFIGKQMVGHAILDFKNLSQTQACFESGLYIVDVFNDYFNFLLISLPF